MLIENIVELPLYPEPIVLDWTNIFGNPNPIKIEIGPGKGEFLIYQASREVNSNFIGIEIRYKRVERINTQISKANLKNVKLLLGDARRILREAFAPESVSTFFIHFPDPWPKKRHIRRRIVHTESVETFYQRLIPGGRIYLTTDVETYAQEMFSILKEHPGYKMIYAEKDQCGLPYHNTFHETKFKALGRSIHYFCFEKK